MVIEIGIVLAVIVGIVEAVKRTKKIKKEYLPFIAMLVGILITYLASLTEETEIAYLIFNGLILGLTAVGLFEGFKQGLRIVRP